MFRVRVTIIDRHNLLRTVEKQFKTEVRRTEWIDKQIELGNLRQVLAYSDEV